MLTDRWMLHRDNSSSGLSWRLQRHCRNVIIFPYPCLQINRHNYNLPTPVTGWGNNSTVISWSVQTDTVSTHVIFSTPQWDPMRMDDNVDAKRILLASPSADWRRQPGRPRITWLSTIQQDLKQHHLTLPEAADLAQNRPLWTMMSMYGATQS